MRTKSGYFLVSSYREIVKIALAARYASLVETKEIIANNTAVVVVDICYYYNYYE